MHQLVCPIHGGEAIDSNVELMYPERSTGNDPIMNPQKDLSDEQWEKFRERAAMVVTVSIVRVTEVIKGDAKPGDEIRVSQLGGTLDGFEHQDDHTTFLSGEPDYALFLADHGPGTPYDLLNPEQAMYEVDGAGVLQGVREGTLLEGTTVGQLKAEVAAQ